MKVWETNPAPNLLKDAKESRGTGAGELKFPATAIEAGLGMDLVDKPPFQLLQRADTSGPQTTEVGFLLGFSRHVNRRM